MRSAVLRPTPGIFVRRAKIAGANGRDEFLHIHAGENFQGEGWADSGGAEEKFEEVLFARGKEAVEREGVFADVGVNQQSDFRVQIAESGESGKRDGDEIADAADIEDYLVRAFIEEAAAEESNHRWPVLPEEGGGVNARTDGGVRWCGDVKKRTEVLYEGIVG